ncbi:MAG: hypothetical protein SGBAC_012083 [Bacillariaceae sp.]
MVDGLEAKFAGFGDLHSAKCEYLQRETNLDLIFDFDQANDGEDSTCHYGIRVYPPAELRDTNTTNSPWQFTIMLGGVFVFTAAVFLLYDYMVKTRQNAALKSALQSGKLVRSLFPEAARDRLYEEQ